MEYTHCGIAEDRTNGVYFCTRQKGHEGPCAAVLSDIVQGGTDFGKERERWTRYRFTIEELIGLGKFAGEHKKTACPASIIVVAESGASGIGTNTVVRCPHCNMHEDVSDYNSW